MKIKVYLLNAFGVNSSGGNPAGVVLDAENLTDEQKKHIAKEIGFSETAFVQKSSKADFKVTFFTPTDELDLCGHATIATYSLLFQKALIKAGKYKQELKAGVFGIAIKDGGEVVMEQALPTYSDLIPLEEITSIFSIPPEAITQTGLPPQIVSTGLRDIFLPIADRKSLFALQPNLQEMSKFNKKTETTVFHVFTFDTIDPDATVHCRNFGPLYGIDEEAATGSSSGALACYLFKHGQLSGKNLQKLKFEQGYSMNKPSVIMVALETQADKITRVNVSGKATIIGKKDVTI